MPRETRGRSRYDAGPAPPRTDSSFFVKPCPPVFKVHLCFQDCVVVQNDETLLLKAPKESQNMRTAERGITQSMHKFSFTKVGDGGCNSVGCTLQLYSFAVCVYH